MNEAERNYYQLSVRAAPWRGSQALSQALSQAGAAARKPGGPVNQPANQPVSFLLQNEQASNTAKVSILTYHSKLHGSETARLPGRRPVVQAGSSAAIETARCTLKFGVCHYELLGTTYIGSVTVDLIKYLNLVAKDMELVKAIHMCIYIYIYMHMHMHMHMHIHIC